jgi:hypothetical protein
MGVQISADRPAYGGEMQDLHANVCEDVYNAGGLSIGVVSVVSLELIVKYIGMREIGLQNSF